ncbi:hypothetical protein P4654_25065 [Niallia taxi]|nr:hypothetical protein [Niallia taxi]MED4118874.1 hypothetical protein [Niallia taxi]
MDKIKVMVYFSLFAEEFPIEEITKRLKITPSETYKKRRFNS